MKCKGIKKTDSVLKKDGENGIVTYMYLINCDIVC
jgi:hypothetical protein